MTTSEVAKRQEVSLALALQQEAAEVQERAEQALTGGRHRGGSHGGPAQEDGAPGQPGQQPPQQQQGPQQQQQRQRRKQRQALPNAYDRGPWRNLAEVLWPRHALAAAQAGKKGA